MRCDMRRRVGSLWRRRSCRWVVGSFGVLLLTALLCAFWQRSPPRESSPQGEVATEVKAEPPPPPPRYAVPEIELVRLAYRNALREALRVAMYGVGLILLCTAIICFILVYTPKHIPSAMPFDPVRERRRPKQAKRRRVRPDA